MIPHILYELIRADVLERSRLMDRADYGLCFAKWSI